MVKINTVLFKVHSKTSFTKFTTPKILKTKRKKFHPYTQPYTPCMVFGRVTSFTTHRSKIYIDAKNLQYPLITLSHNLASIQITLQIPLTDSGTNLSIPRLRLGAMTIKINIYIYIFFILYIYHFLFRGGFVEATKWLHNNSSHNVNKSSPFSLNLYPPRQELELKYLNKNIG